MYNNGVVREFIVQDPPLERQARNGKLHLSDRMRATRVKMAVINYIQVEYERNGPISII